MGDVELGEERANQFTDYSFLIFNVDLNMASTYSARSLINTDFECWELSSLLFKRSAN